MLELIGVLAGGAAAVGGYLKTKGFVARRLRYVDKVQNGAVPWIAGGVATAAAVPVVALLPIIGAGTAVAFGVAVGAGTAAGARAIKKDTWAV